MFKVITIKSDPAYQFEKCALTETIVTHETDEETGETKKVETTKPIIITDEKGQKTFLTGKDLEALTMEIVYQATMGLSCPTCNQYYEFKPSPDLNSYTPKTQIETFKNNRFCCEKCGTYIILKYSTK